MSYPGHSLGESYTSAEMQSMYSATPADWATKILCEFKNRKTLKKQLISMAKVLILTAKSETSFQSFVSGNMSLRGQPRLRHTLDLNKDALRAFDRNGYRRRKWTRRHEFKSWTRLIAFHIALILLGKVWIQLFSLQLWVNSRTD